MDQELEEAEAVIDGLGDDIRVGHRYVFNQTFGRLSYTLMTGTVTVIAKAGIGYYMVKRADNGWTFRCRRDELTDCADVFHLTWP